MVRSVIQRHLQIEELRMSFRETWNRVRLQSSLCKRRGYATKMYSTRMR